MNNSIFNFDSVGPLAVWHKMPQHSPNQIASLIGITENQLKTILVKTGTISEKEYALRIVAAYELDTGSTLNQDRCYRCGVLVFADREETPQYLNELTHQNKQGLCPECYSQTDIRLNWEQLMLLKGWRRGLGETWLHNQLGAIFSDGNSSKFRAEMRTPKQKGESTWAS